MHLKRDATIKWISSDGGPLIVVEQAYLPDWQGASDSSKGGLTDYERAGEVTDWLGFINVGEGTALVLSGDDTAATWLESETNGKAMLVRWIYADSEAELIRIAQSLNETDGAKANKLEWEIRSDGLILLAACEAGTHEPYPRLKIKIPMGSYQISTIEYEDAQTCVICHGFSKTA